MPQICFHILLVGGGFSKKLLSREREKTIIWTNSFRSNQQNTFLKRHSTIPLSTDRNLTEFLCHIFNLNLGLEIDRGIVLEKITNFYLFFKTENQPVSNNSMRTLKLQRVELTLHSYKSLSLSHTQRFFHTDSLPYLMGGGGFIPSHTLSLSLFCVPQ